MVRDLKGEVFGDLIVLAQAGRTKRGEPLWLCRCACSKLTTVRGQNLASGRTQTCGCGRVRALYRMATKEQRRIERRDRHLRGVNNPPGKVCHDIAPTPVIDYGDL